MEQKHGQIRKPVAYASRFLNKLDERCSTNELELLAIVWALEHFKYYLYGNKFTLQTDHQALLSALKNNRGNKTYQSRLLRWVDRLLPFNFIIEHIPGKNMGFADYPSRHPSGSPTPINEDDEKFVIILIDEIKHAFLKRTINPLGSNKPTGKFNQSESSVQNERNDVTNTKENTHSKESAFCHINSRNKLILSSHSLLSRIKPKLIAITTRACPKLNTVDIPIKKRFRAPNKNNSPMVIQNPSKIMRDTSTQTDPDSNKGKGLTVLNPDKHAELLTAIDNTPTPEYRMNFMRVFNEKFIAENSKKDLGPIIDVVESQDWLTLKKANPVFHKIYRDLSVTPSGCLLYDNRLVIPAKLRPMVLQTIHSKHPGQADMLALAKLVWYPHIHSEIVAQPQSCRHCIEKGKNLKPLTPKTNLGSLSSLVEPNEEIQMDFADPIPYKNNTQNNYILVTVDRLSKYPHAAIFNNCDTNSAIEYLENYCKVHGIPRSIRCDQAQAFKAKEFDIFCKNKNIKLKLAPVGDHRGTGMVERLIQTTKRRLAVLDIDPNWSNTTLANKLANII